MKLWCLELGILPIGHPGRVEEYDTREEVEAAAICQAQCDRFNGLRVEGTVKTGYVMDGCYYVRVIHKLPIPKGM